jgi:hypothetical protein
MPMANKRRKGDEERLPMADGIVDPLDNFVGRFRMMCGGDHVMVGPPGGCADDPKVSMDRQVIQVIGPARGMTQALCASNWYFDVPRSLPERHHFMRDMQALLAGLLNRDFATVEIASYSSIIEFARAVEARWPCPQATATRERLEARQPQDEGQERRRRVSV